MRDTLRAAALGATIICVISGNVAFADKLDDFQLDRDGKPLADTASSAAAPVLLLPGASGYARVERPELRTAKAGDVLTQAKAISGLVVAGPTADEKLKGVQSTFPEGSRLHDVIIDGDWKVSVLIDFPDDFITSPTCVQGVFDSISDSIIKNLQGLPLRSFEVLARKPGTTDYLPLDRFMPPVPPSETDTTPDYAVPHKTDATSRSQARFNQFPRPAGTRPTGALSGKAVYLNPGHGWDWREADSWGLQRGFTQNNIEDFSNVEYINQWLWAYCYNAGADVFSCREIDLNTNMVVVDNNDGNDGTKGYFETGSGWADSSLAGYANGRAPYTTGQDPFSFGTNRLIQCVVGAPTASASWVPQIPQAGWYNVYASHAAFSNRSSQAHYRIFHSGGTTDYYVDQRMRRFTWILLGSYYFESGVNSPTGKVVLYNDSLSASDFISADAVRFGGGMSLLSRGAVGVSGKPRYEEEARYHLQYSGAPTSVYDSSSSDQSDGWSGRPKFGRWLRDISDDYGVAAQDSVFISSHTNAFDGTVKGLGTFVYTGSEGTWHDTFRNYVHDEVFNDCNKGYSTLFVNHGTGKKYGTYGENNPSNVSDTMPIFLGEWLFHDNATDMSFYHDPKFRQTMARGICQGIVKFWANRNATAVNLLPEPPRNLRVRQLSATSVQLNWDQPLTDSQGIRGDAATGYKVYMGTHGRGFPAGTVVSGGASTGFGASGLTPGTTYFFYVTATNPGGESFPTETLVVRTSDAGNAPKILIVNGFDKLDIATRLAIPYSGSTLYRQRNAKMNTYDYVVEHAKAIEKWAKPVAFDSCEDEAVELNYVNLADYAAVVWIGGIQAEVSTTDPTNDISISATQQSRITTYLAGGGKLFISGAELAWDLDRGGATTFVDNYLKANYVADSAGVFSATASAGSLFDGLGVVSFDDGTGPFYKVTYPDVITPVGGSAAAMTYGGGSNLLDAFDSAGGWQDPNYSSQTTADAASAFSIVSSPVLQGTGAGDLYYVWGTGSYIREYNSGLPVFPLASTLSVWMYGDNSGNKVRLCVRDSETTSDLFVSDYVTVDFTGWRKVDWQVGVDPTTKWAGNGDGLVTGPNLKLDSIHVSKGASSPASGHLYFDSVTYTPTSGGGPTAAVQFDGGYKLVYLAFPFETITDATKREQLMSRTLDFFFPVQWTMYAQDPLADTTGWYATTQVPAGSALADFDLANTALRANVTSDTTRYRVAAWATDSAKWMPYSAVGTDKYVRGKFYIYRGGQANPNQLNTIPNLRLRLSSRYAMTSMLEVFNHTNLSANEELRELELRPSADPLKPSLYRVDFDPVDVPYLVTNAATEGISRGFEAYAINPQDNGYVALAESVIGTYPVSSTPDSVSPAKVYQTSASDAGDLSSGLPGVTFEAFSIVTGANPGEFGMKETGYAPEHSEGPGGFKMDSRTFLNDLGGNRIGIVTVDFDAGSDFASRVRVEPGRQYKVRFHVTSTQQSNLNPMLRLRTRSIRFAWSQKLELGGAWAAGSASNTIAQQALPGIGCLNPDKNPQDTAGGWYTLLLHTPMSLDIRADGAGDLAARMPNISAEPGSGVNSASRRDIRVGCDLLDTLSPAGNAHLEGGDFIVDRIEVRSYGLVGD